MSSTAVSPAIVESVRTFNRFYTRQLGLLGDHHLDSELSLTEVRVLYELAHGQDRSPSALARAFDLDAGYLTRLVQALEKRGLVGRAPSADDARRSILSLTAEGRKAVNALEEETRRRIAELLKPLVCEDRLRLAGAMRRIESILARERTPDTPVVIRAPRPGDIGWVIHRQAEIYHAEFGWDWTYEGLMAGICGKFIEHFDPAFEHCWIAERDGDVIGSAFVVRKSATVAQLRLLYVDPSARGMGLGARLVDESIAFARSHGYRRLTLWTNDVLVSARRIYQAAGFTLTSEERHRSFGQDLVGQAWDLRL